MYVLKQLRRNKGISQSDLGREIGVSLRTIQLYEKKGANIPIKNLTKIADFFELSIAELYLHELNDTGGSYTSKQPFTKHGNVFYPLDYGKYLVMPSLILMEQQQWYIDQIGTKNFDKTAFQMGFIIDFLEDGAYRAFEVSGDSMNDGSIHAIPNKSIVLGVEIPKETLSKKEDAIRDMPCVLIGKDRILCKWITKFDSEKGMLHCQNLNKSPEYQDFELPLSEVLQIFKVIKKQL